MTQTRLTVLIVDDSPVFRKVLTTVLEEDPRFQIVNKARNGHEALDMVRKLRPDVVILDVEMPVLDGLSTLKALRTSFGDIDVIMFSSLTSAGAEVTFQALDGGAFDFVPKPETRSIEDGLASIRKELTPKLTFLHTRKTLREVSSGMRFQHRPKPSPNRGLARRNAAAAPLPAPRAEVRRVVALGISTGGPRALAQMVPALPANFPVGLLIVQHMPPVFTGALAKRLNESAALEVQEAVDGQEIKQGMVLLAPGGRHMTVQPDGRAASLVRIRLTDTPPVHNCRPSVDVLFDSVNGVYGAEAVGVIMTGMGSDGVEALRRMKQRGAYIIAQNEATCTVYGMPRKPVEEGLADDVVPLDQVASAITRAVSPRHS